MGYGNLFIWMVFFYTTFVGHLSHVPKSVSEFIQIEGDVLNTLEDYISHERERLNQLKEKVNEWKEIRDSLKGQEQLYIQNPVNLFHLFKMLTVDLEEFEMKMTTNSFKETMNKNLSIPSNDDLKDCIRSLLKLQYQYDLKPKDLMFGKLLDFESESYLSVEDCIFIGETCMESNDYVCATDWLNDCLIYARNDTQKTQILKMMYPLYVYLGNKELAYTYASQYLNLEPLEIAASDIKLETGIELGKLIHHEPYILESRRTCRGFYSHLSLTQNYKCRYNHENSPFLKIAPLKEEELYKEPRIVIYREAIYDSEINAIKSWSLNNLNAATVYGNDGKSRLSGFIYRISETAFLDNKSSFLEKMGLRIQDMSLLSLEHSEWLQIINYAPGGFYRVHSDYLPKHADNLSTLGNRMVSLLFYMNTVTLGGGTVFPRLKLLVEPIKGSVLIWHNMTPDGLENVWTQHCACPVILGEKWAFTQWIRSNQQQSIRNFYTTFEQKPGQSTFEPPTIENLGKVTALENDVLENLWNEVSHLGNTFKKLK